MKIQNTVLKNIGDNVTSSFKSVSAQDYVVSRLHFYKKIENMITINERFNLISLRIVNIAKLHKNVGYLRYEQFVDESISWVVDVLNRFAHQSKFEICKQDSDTVAILIQEDISDNRLRMLNYLLSVKFKPFTFNPLSRVSCLVGACAYPKDGRDSYSLFSCIEDRISLQKDISIANNDDSTLNESFSRFDLIEGLNRKQFELWYQPKVNLQTGNVIGVEGLVRWNHPLLGVLLPCDFLARFVELDAMVELNAYVIETAFAKSKELQLAGSDIKVSLNLDAASFVDDYTIDKIDELQNKFDVIPENIEFEIIETVQIEQGDKKTESLTLLRERGYQVSIDDFGTGCSNIHYLMFLPANIIKLDRVFSGNISDKTTLKLAESAVNMAKAANLSVVAEGIETEEQRKAMIEIGCDIGQGWLFGRPQQNFSI